MDPNDLNDISDVGIYYRDGGGTISNVPSGSTPFVLEVLPMWYTGSYWIMMQRQIVSGGGMYIRTIYGNNEWGKWRKYQHSEYSI